MRLTRNCSQGWRTRSRFDRGRRPVHRKGGRKPLPLGTRRNAAHPFDLSLSVAKIAFCATIETDVRRHAVARPEQLFCTLPFTICEVPAGNPLPGKMVTVSRNRCRSSVRSSRAAVNGPIVLRHLRVEERVQSRRLQARGCLQPTSSRSSRRAVSSAL